jgi:hypothetical protein
VPEQTIYAYDGPDSFAYPICGGNAVEVDFEAQPDLACSCPCHEMDQPCHTEDSDG